MAKKVRFGIIGAGGIADRRTMPGMMLASDAEITAIMEIDPVRAEYLRGKYKADKAYTDWRTLIADSSVDAVYIATPVEYHMEQAITAARTGKHILIEKPVALSSEQAEKVRTECEKAGVKAAVGFMMRRHACHMKMRELIAKGKIGDIVSSRAQLTCWYPPIEGAWRQNKAQSGGGALTDMGVHCIDLLEYITGARGIDVRGYCYNRTFDYNIEDSANILIKMSNGSVSYVDAHFNIPDAAAFCRLEVYGTKGSLLAEGTIGQTESGSVRATLIDEAGDYDAKQERSDSRSFVIDPQSLPYAGNIYTKEIEAFCRSVIDDTEVDVPLSDAIHVQKLVEECYR